ncbi:futalosine hydrolase [Oryzomonas sagensis]|uniref:Futalosine hydrolase n=1 Tax=Oryzomonas sagensis TaxID=2603857 RepID=A0ABQ6TQS5_9BACT|nr:futalosine hydrolase [Oryzomonas sagensis]KAB0671305.1 futalosine hydrolase [Oryzomonas sagensis]
MQPILIMTAVPQEMTLLEHALTNTVRRTATAFEYAEGTIGTLPVLLCAGGVGKINAAAATATLIERCRPRLVINTGCAGAYPGSGLSIGHLAVASNEILGDEGVLTTGGWRDLRFMELPSFMQGKRAYHNEIPLSKHAAEKAMQLADYYGVFLMRGRFVTVSTCSGTRQRGETLARHFNAIAESMEGAAVAQICLRSGVDCLEIRGISNPVVDRDMSAWDIPRAAESAQRFVLKYLEDLDRPELSAFMQVAPER